MQNNIHLRIILIHPTPINKNNPNLMLKSLTLVNLTTIHVDLGIAKTSDKHIIVTTILDIRHFPPKFMRP